MAEPYLAEIRIMSFNFAPRGWAQCDGQLLPISQNQALFSLLGTTYGGNGTTTFALPDLRGRVPLHFGSGFVLGQKAGEEAHTLTQAELPAHTHPLMASSSNGDQPTPSILASANNLYGAPDAGLTTIGAGAPNGPSVVPTGGQAHTNMMPFQVVTFCIALQGIFPSPN